MSATVIKKDGQTTLPPDVREAAGLVPSDQIEWRFEDGEIRGRKVKMEIVEIIDLDDVNPETLLPKDGSRIIPESIAAAVRADREGRA